ncbi:MAG: GspE/PulE family protein, partial [Planctomycetota bacterium]
NKLGLPNASLSRFRAMLARPHGLVLVTGPTGSGKTTTLYSAIELIKGIQRNVVTVEDPVEYQLDLINQVQVRSETGMSFAAALRAILRQDPDVIMVGEIRDRETAETAIGAALTGHLVLSTLHTNDAASAVTRLVDMGVDRFKIAASLVGVVAQRLVRVLCPQCRELFYPASHELAWIRDATAGREIQTSADGGYVRARGCSHCFETGYRGRVGLYELLDAHSELRTLINDGATLDQLRAAARGPNLASEGLRLAAEHQTSLDEVARIAIHE